MTAPTAASATADPEVKPQATMRSFLQLLRVRQWVKNGFVLAPVFFGGQVGNSSIYLPILAATVTFCFASSAVYVFNDWRDIEADRCHIKKRRRPLASGAISVRLAGGLAAALLAGAVATMVLARLPPLIFLTLAFYVAINLSYSLGLKHVPVLELFLVSSGYVIRIVAGGIAASIVLSPWIVMATGMISLLLATGKRRGDLAQDNDPDRLRRSLEGYSRAYLDAVLSAIAGGTFVVYLLFSVSDYAKSRYGAAVLLGAVPVAMGIFRYLQIVMVEDGGDSPTDIVLRDRFMLATIATFLLIFCVLIYL